MSEPPAPPVLPALPKMIGPYRVEQRLGAGGMGEVFLAYDARLDRRVAIKRIRPDAGITPERRERFRREARVSARLSHHAIVQVHDILTEGDLEYIVMEHVEGTDLHALIERGALDVPRVVALARQLADGLDAAHRQGIVHRDLKAENVLFTPGGQAKITDFGIAKQLLAKSGESLTRENAVLGTCRTMSPEQARGEDVDHRTDLFAFGVLLYEALTGRSPFAADTSLATLSRVIHQRQKPVREINPAVPEALSDLVDRLLEKDPALRPQSAGQVRRQLDALSLDRTETDDATVAVLPAPGSGGTPWLSHPQTPHLQTPHPQTPSRPPPPADSALTTLKPLQLRSRVLAWTAAAVAVAALAGGYLALRPPPQPLYVGVERPEIGRGAGNGEVELLASGVRVALLQGLVSLQGISPKAFDEMDAAAGTPQDVARIVSADEIVTSRLDCRPEACRISLNRLRGSDGSVVWASESFEIATDDFSVVASAVTRQLRRSYADHPTRPGTPELAASGRDLEEFLKLRQAFDAGHGVAADQILAGLDGVRGRSPRFLDAYVFEAEVLRHRFLDSRAPDDLQRALGLIAEARALAPNDPQPLLVLIDLALAGNQQEVAEKTLAEVQDLLPGDARVTERRARLLGAEGRPEDALATLRTAAKLHPSAKRLGNLAQMEFQLGHIAAARQHLDLLLQRSPGDLGGLSLLAVIELQNGDLHRAAGLYSDIVRRSPSQVQLSNLGLAYFFLGRYAEAAATYRRILDGDPNNPLYTLNLADACFLMGRRAEAQALYQRAVTLIEADPAARGAQFLSVKAQALAHLGQGQQAVIAIQEALRLAPDQGPTAYEAALVYTLLGEDNSALVNAEKAVRLGFGPRWFSFPWFDALRRHPELQAILARGQAPQG
jgi:serine/threonine protein kinase/tetratricopeptide (TPR) repeat protein